MSGMQAQCWFWVCPDCNDVIESIRETHCDGAIKGPNRIPPPLVLSGQTTEGAGMADGP